MEQVQVRNAEECSLAPSPIRQPPPAKTPRCCSWSTKQLSNTVTFFTADSTQHTVTTKKSYVQFGVVSVFRAAAVVVEHHTEVRSDCSTMKAAAQVQRQR